jgi:hypothetical protein
MTPPPSTPPPFEPPVPVADGGSGGGGSRWRLVVGAAAGVIAITVAALLLAGDDDEPTRPAARPAPESTADAGEVGSTLPEGFTDRAQLEELFTEQYQEAFGIDEDRARCLAGQLSEGIEEGQLTEEQAMTEILGFLDACGISLEEIRRTQG